MNKIKGFSKHMTEYEACYTFIRADAPEPDKDEVVKGDGMCVKHDTSNISAKEL